VTLFTLGLLIVAAIQAGLFIEQLRLIRISSNDTAKAANAARDSADAARAGLELTKDVAKRQLRAYVHVTETRIFWKNGAYVLVARFRNSGQTPAYKYVLKLGLAADVYPFDTQRITKMFDEAEVFASQQSLPAGAFTENVQRFSLDQNATEAILSGKCAYWFYGKITYVDVFENAQSTHFRQFSRGHEWSSGRFTVDSEGNESS